jgi:predicted Zn finger-like uncharacterized protein
MPLRITCDSCGKKLAVRDDLAGKKVKCPQCGTSFVAAAPSSEIKAAPTRPAPAKPAPAKSAPPPQLKDKVSPKPMAKKPVPPPPMDDDDDDDDV